MLTRWCGSIFKSHRSPCWQNRKQTLFWNNRIIRRSLYRPRVHYENTCTRHELTTATLCLLEPEVIKSTTDKLQRVLNLQHVLSLVQGSSAVAYLVCVTATSTGWMFPQLVRVPARCDRASLSTTQGSSLPDRLLHTRVSRLRPANRHRLIVLRHRRSTLGRRAFAVAGPTFWNSLPVNLRDPTISFQEMAYGYIQTVNFSVSVCYLQSFYIYILLYNCLCHGPWACNWNKLK